MLGISILMILVGQTWAKAYDRVWMEDFSFNDTAYAIACDTFSDISAYVVVGHTDNGPLGGLDVLVTKLRASDGSVIWSRAYGFLDIEAISDDYGRSVIVDYDGYSVYYAIAGYSDVHWPAGTNTDALVFKIRAIDGILVWGNVYLGGYFIDPDWINTDDYLYSIVKDGGDYLVAGNVEPGPCGGLSDVLVFKVDAATGFLAWPCACAYGKFLTIDPPIPKDDYAYSIIEDHTSGTPCSLFVVAGKSVLESGLGSDILVFKGRKSDGWIDPVTGWIYDYGIPGHFKCAYSIKNDHIAGYILTGDTDTSIVVMRLNPNLNVGWGGNAKIYSIPNLANSRCIQPTSDGDYVLTGFTAPSLTNSHDLLAMKIDQTGAIIWSKVLAGCLNQGTQMVWKDYGQWIIECPPDTYVAAGYTEWPQPSPWTPTNLLVAKMDVNGDIPCWQHPDTCMKDIETLVDSPEVAFEMSKCEYEIWMEWMEIEDTLVQVRDSVICRSGPTGIEESSAFPSIHGVYNLPNPFVSKTTIYYNLRVGGDVRLTIYDMTGRLVYTLVEGYIEAGEHTVVWDGGDGRGRRLAQGVYFYKIQSGNQTENRKIILIQ